MPLATICGYPGAGKTRVGAGLVEYLSSYLVLCDGPVIRKALPDRRVVLINEEELHISKAEGYKDATAEKITRGSLKAKVDQSLNADTLVVLDSMNYIKGFRYELHCSARQENTQHCIVWVQTPREVAAEWNASRPEEEAYPTELLTDLTNRFEPPDDRNRWDRPLIKVDPSRLPTQEMVDSSEADRTAPIGEARSLESVYQEVVDALVGGRAPSAGLATQVVIRFYCDDEQVVRGEADALYELDQVTQRIVSKVCERAPSASVGEVVHVEGSTKPVILGRRVSVAELKRLRRQFVKQAVALETAGQMAETFVEFLNTHVA